MTTIKSYTDIEQSRKLAKILPIETADMFIADVFDKEKETHSYNFHILSTWGCNTFEELKDRENKFVRFIPCWSLAALLNVLPKYELNNFGDTIQLDVNLEALATEGDETLLDLVVNMIIHLHKRKML